MMQFPIVVREIRRQLRSGLFWAAALGLPAWARFTGAQGDGPVQLLVALAGIIVFYSAWRTMTAEREGDAVWMLAATPISPISVVLQVAAASMLVWGLPIVGSTLAIPDVQWSELLHILCKGVPLVVLASAHGALLALWLAPNLARIETVAAVTLPALVTLFFGAQRDQLTSGELFLLGVLLWLGYYVAWRGTGAEWPSMNLAGAVRWSGSRGAVWSVSRVLTGWWGAVPDAFSPLLWKELMQGKAFVIAIIGMGVLGMMSQRSAWHAGFDTEAIAAIALYMGTPFLILSSAESVMRDRREGVWEELRVTGISPASIVRAKVLSSMTLWLSAVAILLATHTFLFFFLESFCPGGELAMARRYAHPPEWIDCALLAGLLILTWWQAILTGLVGGLVSSGWKGFVATAILAWSYLLFVGWSTSIIDRSLCPLVEFAGVAERWLPIIYVVLISALYIVATTRFAQRRIHVA